MYCRLSQDVFQTAKISKLLLAANKGTISKYNGKALDDIELTDTDTDTLEDSENEG